MRYRIIADSSSNLRSVEEVDFRSVPIRVLFEGTEYTDESCPDPVGLMRAIHASQEGSSTNCPSVGDWLDAFAGADAIFCVTISSALSGSWQSAVAAAQQYREEHPEVRIHVIDSKATGPSMQILVELLKSCIQAGDPFDEIVRKAETQNSGTRILYMLESLMNLAKAGRVRTAVAHIAGMLGIRIIGTGDEKGEIRLLAKLRGEKKALQDLFEKMKAGGYRGGKVRISHCDNLRAAKALAEKIRREFFGADVGIVPCTTLCSYYADLGGLIVSFDSAG